MMMMIKGSLYQTKKVCQPCLDEQDAVAFSQLPEIGTNIKTTAFSVGSKLKARWSFEEAQDIKAFYGIDLKSGVCCHVSVGTVVIYVETGKTGSYKLICGDFIGWVSDTLNLLEEVEDEKR